MLSSILSKNKQKLFNMRYHSSKLNFFVRFLGVLKKPRRNFEVNWPSTSITKNVFENLIVLNRSMFRLVAQARWFLKQLIFEIVSNACSCSRLYCMLNLEEELIFNTDRTLGCPKMFKLVNSCWSQIFLLSIPIACGETKNI